MQNSKPGEKMTKEAQLLKINTLLIDQGRQNEEKVGAQNAELAEAMSSKGQLENEGNYGNIQAQK